MPRIKYTNSNYKTCWDNKEIRDISSIESLIMNQYKLNYIEKHELISATNEFEALNDKEIICCPHCGSISFIKHGFNRDKTQRYYCKDCHKHFSPVTNTLLENHKIPMNHMLEFFNNIFHFQSIKSAARNNKNSQKTGIYWIKKLFLCLKNYQDDTKLGGRIYIDEIYIKDRKSKSSKQYCISVAFDGYKFFARVLNNSKPNNEQIYNLYKDKIKPGSTIVRDLNNCYEKLIKELNLVSIKFVHNKKSNKGQNTSQVNEPLCNKIRFLKLFLRKHSSYLKGNLQDYLNLYSFIQNGPDNILRKTKIVLKMFYELPLTLKYNDFSSKIANIH